MDLYTLPARVGDASELRVAYVEDHVTPEFLQRSVRVMWLGKNQPDGDGNAYVAACIGSIVFGCSQCFLTWYYEPIRAKKAIFLYRCLTDIALSLCGVIRGFGSPSFSLFRSVNTAKWQGCLVT